ncbi:hypothetical protein EZV62_015268 [Acer yangbiense]|uniref:Uncharacterized protein n=1 Tax=Acer yangbiense TaxID=1000413 RepID=A0A5C7HUX4_9ROSI|nr:hypothetical protein EZV62_015268 [Acer yangbiense]
MGDNSPEKKTGCGLLNAVFGRRWPRRTNSSSSLPGIKDNNNNFVKITQSTPTPKRRRNSSDDNTFLEAEAEGVSEAPPNQLASKSAPNNQPIKPPPPVNVYQQQQHIVKKGPQAASVQEALPQKQKQQQHQLNSYNSQGYVNQGRRVPREATGISGELESMIADHQKSKGSNTLVRASSSNVMLFGNLGNLRQGGGNTGSTANTNTYEQFFETSSSSSSSKQPNKYPNSVMGNVVKKQNDDSNHDRAVPVQDASLCRALSTRMDPETLKMMGNEDYKSGNFAEALALYDAAISIDPNKASYRSNKSAALTALGRLLEAVFECREAIRIEPRYHRAHHRLATLYLRLGEVEKAIYHYKHAGPEADQIDIAKCKTVQGHLNKCTDVKRMRDWNSLIKETAAAISAGADSAPSIYALQAEALLKVHRHQEADEAMENGSKFSVDDCTKFFGPIGNANLLVVQAQVNLAVGRFDDALAAVQKAAKLDSNNKEVNPVMRRARAVAAARSNGNELFKASRFSEASVAYGEGLEHDPYNSVLLCNRAACRSKLGQYEKAVEDCNSALNVRPKYSKARLRRANCYAKLEKWESSIKDYEILQRESPEDEEVIKALQEAQAQLKKKHGGS